MTPAPRFAMRVDPAELQRWRTAAEARGQSITAWLHDAASAHLGQQSRQTPKPSAPVATTCPPHPRAALVTVNAGLGLKRCGACGDTVR